VVHRPLENRGLAWGLMALGVNLARAKLERMPDAPPLGLSVTAPCAVTGLPAIGKVYPHQRDLPPGHWENPMEDRTQNRVGNPPKYQEYRRPPKKGEEQRDDQPRSLLGWVSPGRNFSLMCGF
jgi:hypothetical protein